MTTWLERQATEKQPQAKDTRSRELHRQREGVVVIVELDRSQRRCRRGEVQAGEGRAGVGDDELRVFVGAVCSSGRPELGVTVRLARGKKWLRNGGSVVVNDATTASMSPDGWPGVHADQRNGKLRWRPIGDGEDVR